MAEKDQRWWDWTSALLLVVALFTAILRLETTRWTDNIGRIEILVLAGVVLGLALGRSRFSGGLSFFFGLLFTLSLTGWSLAALIDSELWLERTTSLLGRLGVALGQLFGAKPVSDPLLFLTSMTLLFFICSLWSGYLLVRQARPWGGLVPVALVVIVVEYSFDMYGVPDPGTTYSLIFLLMLVLLVARVTYLRSHFEWETRGQMVEAEVGFDISRGAAIAAVILVVAAWLSPQVVKAITPGTPDNAEMAEQFQTFRDQVSRAVSSLRSPAPLVIESMGETLGLGQGSSLSDETVFTVKPENGRIAGLRFYWTGRTYDTYLNNQWVATGGQTVSFGAGTGTLNYALKGRVETQVEISSRIAYLRTLFFPGAPMTLSRLVTALNKPTGDQGYDIAALVLDPPLRAGESYTVRSLVSLPTVTDLRTSVAEPYPDWVKNGYLQVPENLSPRIAELAKEITASAATPYDKTAAVTNWLRANITYTATVPQPPAGRDLLEWFLFDLKSGFCNYYASAEVMMLRTLGIPARLAVGYAEGTWDPELQAFSVIGKEYHAWPEVYFPGYGWVPFEPTVSQPATAYPQGGQTTEAPQEQITTPPPTPQADRGEERANQLDAEEAARRQQAQQDQTRRTILYITFSTGAAGLLAFAIYRFSVTVLTGTTLPVWLVGTLASRGVRAPRWLSAWAITSRRTPMETQFAVVPFVLRIWGQDPPGGLTPSEQVARLSMLVPETAAPAGVLLDEYLRSAYSPHAADLERAREAATQVRLRGMATWLKQQLNFGPR